MCINHQLTQGFSIFLAGHQGPKNIKDRCLRTKWTPLPSVFLCILKLTNGKTRMVSRQDLAHRLPIENSWTKHCACMHTVFHTPYFTAYKNANELRALSQIPVYGHPGWPGASHNTIRIADVNILYARNAVLDMNYLLKNINHFYSHK